MAEIKVHRGQSYPLGATIHDGGVNFSLFSMNSTAVELLLFENPEDSEPSHVIRLDPQEHRTFAYWHVYVHGIGSGQIYAYRVFGPHAPERGHRFDSSKLLIDPYARVIVNTENYRREAALQPGGDWGHMLKCAVMDPRGYNWEGDQHLRLPYAQTVIYELHVGGFTRHPSSGVVPEKRGTYAGLIEKIPYLRSLGITAVELMPVQQFDEQDAPPGLTNYWGYSPVAFFAPHRGYSSRTDVLGPVDEFRDMVKALHRAGIEVILDVVFNHTAEGDHRGPVLGFKGLENSVYYMLDPRDPSRYLNFSGCGNTLNTNNSIVRRLILDALRYWVQVMHVDGFRFDLASVMARDEDGQLLRNPPILWEIETDPVLAGTKIIAEAWDAAGLYQVGTFIGHRWAEWNARFRDDVRRFMRGDERTVWDFANRLIGSPDLFHQPDREPNRSINFVTCHDGFTLNDLVSYNQKHNEANLQDNLDGINENFSWNCGVEGPSNDPQVEQLRQRQMRNFLVALLIAQGTPMLLMGDEMRRSQRGNNNAYCQNNEISWLDWQLLEQERGLWRFVQMLVAFTQSYHVFREESFWARKPGENTPRIAWHGVKCNQPDWRDISRSLALELCLPEAGEHVYVAFNAYWEVLTFELPWLSAGQRWHRLVDTSLLSPDDISELNQAPPILSSTYTLEGRSSLVLVALPQRRGGS
ncbi:glycogen debranching protein GlgX [uncultured Thermanaerothrix sp.]|uniref:glycogen debranching protein GlgX n=1 Tax=uncultured Thermanaerothrix sp. TaxID=1195149 RepID=UPI0026342025|nr:glycogen debranching protein GlgX [uncultured Thermanaerothrix sp.]